MQSKLDSFMEALTNILIGGTISFISGLIIYHALGIKVSLMQNVWITVYFTGVSLARSYLIRRWFNAKNN